MSGQSITKIPSMKSTQLQTTNLPPSWETFSIIDAGRQQTIYRTMCDQISSQQKQILGLIEKVRQSDLLSSQKLGDSKMMEDIKRLKSDLEEHQSNINSRDKIIEKLNSDLDYKNQHIEHLESQLYTIKQQQCDISQLKALEEQIKELNSQIQFKNEQIDELRHKLQQLLTQLNDFETQMDEQQRKMNQDNYRQNLQVEQLESDLELALQDKQKLTDELAQLNETINTNYNYKVFEQQFITMNKEFQQIKSTFHTQVKKVKEQEAIIEDLVAKNSRLVIDLYHLQM